MTEKEVQHAGGFPTANWLACERTRLAYERTLMAWVRTATSLISFGFAIYKFFQMERGGTPGSGGPLLGPREFAIIMIGIGLTALFVAVIEHRGNIRRLEEAYTKPTRSLAVLVAGLISILGILALLVVLFRL